MKLILLLLLITLNSMADGVFFIDKQTGKVFLENVISNTLSINTPISGYTYSVNKQNYAVKTETNSDVSIFFSNDVYIKVKESTHFTFDSFDQSVSNLNDLPSKAQYVSYMSSVSLVDGELDVVSNQKELTESFAIINTSLASILLNKGKFVITSDYKTTIIVVLEGTATVLDNSSKKKEIVKAKNTVVIVPAPKFQMKGIETIRRGNIFSIKETSPSDVDSYLSSINQLDDATKHNRFIIINKSVKGVRID